MSITSIIDILVLCSTVYIETNPPRSPLHSQLIAVGLREANFGRFHAICKPRRINSCKTATKQTTLKSLESALTEKVGGGGVTVNQVAQALLPVSLSANCTEQTANADRRDRHGANFELWAFDSIGKAPATLRSSGQALGGLYNVNSPCGGENPARRGRARIAVRSPALAGNIRPP
jgi:hypothetical protein